MSAIDTIISFFPERVRPDPRFVKFLLVGGLNAAFGYSTFILALWLGLHYTLATAVCTVLGTLFNFKSIGALVFKNKDNRLLLRFLIVSGIIYAINVLALAGMLRIGIPEWLGGLILILPGAGLSYYLNSRFVFVI
jgi:putative flippase GtrA